MVVESSSGLEVSAIPRYRLGLFTCCFSAFMMNLDNTIVNIALPDIENQLHPRLSELQWVIDSYLLVLASLLIMSGSLGDRFGRKKVSQIGLIVFGMSSLLCSFSENIHMLIAYRVVQAIGASAMIPAALSLISSMFPDPRLKAKALSLWSMTVGLGMASGPVIGGFLVEAYGWQSVFWVNVPIAIIIVILTQISVPESRSGRIHKADPLGQIFILCTLFSLVYAFIEFPHAKDLFHAALPLFIAILCFILLLFVENRSSHPLIDMRFFTSIPFSTAILLAIVNLAAIGGVLFINTLYLQDYLGKSAIIAGFYSLPMAMLTAISARVCVNILHHYGPFIPILLSGICLIIAAICISIAGFSGSVLLLFTSYILFGIAIGTISPSVNTVAMAGMPKDKAGVAGALASTGRQIGQSLGVAIIGTAFNAGLSGHSISQAYPHAALSAWTICIFLGIITIILGIIANSTKAKHSSTKLETIIQNNH